MSANTFGRDKRLLSADNYSAVFNNASSRVSSSSLLILAKPSVEGFARLGVIASKKHLRHAVKRNRFKRIVRETFRQNQSILSGFDIIVLVRSGFNQVSRENQSALVEKCFIDLVKKFSKSG